ncbi:hypothetical protein FO519_000819 [Halicephalobus sp. NKZ332]|nr:hypothetical protein FO519_000819 [Halicephalobus sp. NKZ332]
MIGALSPYISKIKRSYQSNDIVDRLNYQYTATIISLAAFTLAATQYVGKPIQCWVPPEFTGAWEKYAETYCFASGSYFLPIDDEIDASYSQREKVEITYYQWVPLVLAFQALFFYIPSFIWKALNFSTDFTKFLKHEPDGGDVIDELNYHWTSLILFMIGVSNLGMLYITRPIQCWMPPEFPSQWEAYTEIFCFFGTNTYYYPDRECENDGKDEEFCISKHRGDSQVAYYQWVPVVILLQGAFFAGPFLFWRATNSLTCINVKSILNNAAQVKKKFDKGTRSAQVNKAAAHLTEALEMQRELKTSHSSWLTKAGKSRGIFLTVLYLFTKLLYVLNVVLQFAILNAFLGPQYTFWGIGILKDLIDGREWTESGHFPRVTLCDFNVRVLSNIHRWTVQCVLMINMFNEKIFIFFWFWFLFVGVLSILSLIYWLLATGIGKWRREFVAKYLRCTSAISERESPRDLRLVDGFVKDFLRPDGVFLLRLIQINGGDLLVGEIINALYQKYCSKLEEKSSRAVTESPDSTKL